MTNTRREFLRTTAQIGVGVAAAAVAGNALGIPPSTPPKPTIPPGAPAKPSEPLIIGTGSHRYEVQHDWLKPPAICAWGDTHGLAQDAEGNIYVAHTVHPTSTLKDAVLVFDKNGTFLRSFGSTFAGGAHGLDLRTEGETEYLYHCDTGKRRVVKTKLDGGEIWSITAPMESGAYKTANEWNPTNVAFGPNNLLYVGDGYGLSYVHIYNHSGKWLGLLSKPGTEAGQTKCPHGLVVDSRGRNFTKEPAVCVADRGNRRLQYFALDGKPLGICTEGMRQPCDMKIKGDLMLVPDLDSVVTIVDVENKPIVQLGDGHPSSLRNSPREQFIPGKFVHPHDAIWLADGSILVAEWVPVGRITRLKPVA